jgi:ubiquinol-cytochrome c reductase cytochrome b subunit
MFIVALSVHMFRVFFTGAFRKPREINWVIGSVLALLAIIEGFAGYSLPDDLLSGTGLRAMEGFVQTAPVIGSYLAFAIFGGPFPGEMIIPRLYSVHILLIPAILIGLFTAHIGLVFVQKHTQFPGPGRTNENVVGYPVMPVYAAKAGGFFFIVFGVVAMMAALVQINPIWGYGPYDPSPVTAGSQPDWYMGFLDGSTRLMPNWEIHAWSHTLPLNVILPTVVLPGLLFNLLGAWPWIEQFLTKDREYHNLLDRPRNKPRRTAIGMMGISFYVILLIAGGNDIIASIFSISVQTITHTLRAAIFVVPPLVYWVTKRVCLGLQHADDELVHHGVESGTIRRLPSGEFVEETVGLPLPYQITLTGVEPSERPLLHSGEAPDGPGYGDQQVVPVHSNGDAPVVEQWRRPRGFFRDKSVSRKEPVRPEAVMPPLEGSGKRRK